MPREKRTKPCSNCKRSKVKCIYTSNLPCTRCVRTGQAVSCQFIAKLPSLKLPPFTNPGQGATPLTTGSGDEILPHIGSLSSHAQYGAPQFTNSHALPRNEAPLHGLPAATTKLPGAIISSLKPPTSMQIPSQPLHSLHTPISLPALNPMQQASPDGHPQRYPNQVDNDDQWKNSVENRIISFDSKLNDLVDLLKSNQQLLMMNQQHSFVAHEPLPQVRQQYLPAATSEYYQQYQQLPYNEHNAIQSQVPQPPNLPLIDRTRQNSSFISPGVVSSYSPSEEDPAKSESDDSSSPRPQKRIKVSATDDYPKDFREGYLSKEEANNLLVFFNSNIAQQLFGFDISKFSIKLIWDSCPILVCAICTIASIHHPELSTKAEKLKEYLNDLCSSLLFKGKPSNEEDGFNTIVALVLCSFWLSESQMFTGLALQLAKEYGLNNPYTENKDKLKLWYLLYVLDGQQSLTFNRQRLFNSQEYSLKHSREILLEGESKQLEAKETKMLTLGRLDNNDGSIEEQEEEEEEKAIKRQSTLNADMRLVSQVEYNQALNEAFKGNAWDLLAPSSFGMPSKSNLDLDKWMVSWTVLLAPGSNGAVWSTKSTLIYYNFAKMHINSSAVRQLQINPNESSFPKLHAAQLPVKHAPSSVRKEGTDAVDSEDDSDSDDSDNDSGEFISNKGFLSEDETVISANIAVNAATTVLNLVINDKDILENLRYVPVHIHIMLYYAALLILNPPVQPLKKSLDSDDLMYYKKVITNLKVIKAFQSKIYNNLPIDTKFGDKLIKSLQEIVDDKIGKVREQIGELAGDATVTEELNKQLMYLVDTSSNISEVIDDGSNSESSTPRPEKISAWPGSNHGHP